MATNSPDDTTTTTTSNNNNPQDVRVDGCGCTYRKKNLDYYWDGMHSVCPNPKCKSRYWNKERVFPKK